MLPAQHQRHQPDTAATPQQSSVYCPRSRPHLAMMKSSRTMRDPSPMYFWTSSLPDTRMKVQSVWWATARARRVLPVPGGPYNKTPCRHECEGRCCPACLVQQNSMQLQVCHLGLCNPQALEELRVFERQLNDLHRA
jgi:hypothetical protein